MMPKRIRTHEQETESKNKFSDIVPSRWVFRAVSEDYGVDGEVEIFNESGFATGNRFYVQLKSTDSAKELDWINEPFKISTLNYFSKLKYPVLLVKYIKCKNLLLFKWAHDRNEVKQKKDAKSLTVKFDVNRYLEKDKLHFILRDVENFLELNNKGLKFPFKLKIESTCKTLPKSEIMIGLTEYASNHSLHIQSASDDVAGTIVVSDEDCRLTMGGGCATYGFSPNLQIENKRDQLIYDIHFSLAAILRWHGYFNYASDLFYHTYKKTELIRSDDVVLDILICFLKANSKDAVLESYASFRKNSHLEHVCLKFLFLLRMNFRPENSFDIEVCEKLNEFEIDYAISNCNPEQIETALYNQANFYRSIEKKKKAISYYKKAKSISTHYESLGYFWREIGELLYNANKKRWAKVCYKRAVELNDNRDAEAKLADCILGEGSVLQSWKLLKNYVKNVKDKDFANTTQHQIWLLQYYALSYILFKYKIKSSPCDVKQSEKLASKRDKVNLEKSVQLNVLNTRAWFNLGVLLSAQKEDEEAMYAFLWAAVKRSYDAEAWVNAYMLACFSKKKSLLIGMLIFLFASEHLGAQFFEQISRNIDQNGHLSPSQKEDVKQKIISMGEGLEKKKDIEIRLFKARNNFKSYLR